MCEEEEAEEEAEEEEAETDARADFVTPQKTVLKSVSPPIAALETVDFRNSRKSPFFNPLVGGATLLRIVRKRVGLRVRFQVYAVCRASASSLQLKNPFPCSKCF